MSWRPIGGGAGAGRPSYAARRGLRSYEFNGDVEPWTKVWTRHERAACSLRAYPFSPRGLWALAADSRRIDGRPLWQALGRRLPAPYDAAPLLLFGWISWRRGNGALARTAAERALASNPHYTAAELLLGALSRGADPRRVPRLRLR